MLLILEIKISLVSIKTFLYQCFPTLLAVLVHIWCYIYNSLVHIINVLFICMNGGLFKSYYCYVLILPFEKYFKYYEKCFYFHFYILLRKISLLTTVRNKCVIMKVNLYFLDIMKNDKIFSSKVCHFQFDHRFLFI